MSYCKKTLLLISLLFLLTAVHAQQENQDYFFNDVGWTITMPGDFILYDFIDNSEYPRKSSGYMEDENENTNDVTEVFGSQTMMLAIKDRFNYFNIITSPLDPEEYGSWKSAIQLFKVQAYKNMEKIAGKEKLDTASSIEYIDGLAFDRFHIAVTLNKDVQFEMFLLSTLYRGYDFSITYLSMDSETKKQIELMLQSSRFNKRH